MVFRVRYLVWLRSIDISQITTDEVPQIAHVGEIPGFKVLLGASELNVRLYIANKIGKFGLNWPQNFPSRGVIDICKNYEFLRANVWIFIPNRLDKLCEH